MAANKKPIQWLGSAKKDLKACPKPVRVFMAYALLLAQLGRTHPAAKALKGFAGASVMEIVEDFSADTFRAVYTVEYQDAIYVVHVFQKKSKKGRATPKVDIDLIRQRLRALAAARRSEERK